MRVSVLNWEVPEGLIKKMLFEQRLGGSERVDFRSKNTPAEMAQVQRFQSIKSCHCFVCGTGWKPEKSEPGEDRMR